MATQDFQSRYTRSGRIGNFLISRFYRDLEEMYLRRKAEIRNVLEVGVGAGFSTQRIRGFLDHEVVLEASEYEEELVPVAVKRNPGVVIRQESVYELGRPACSFDLVICLEVLEHLEHPDRALQELARVSKKYVIVSVPREPLWRAMNVMRGKYLLSLGNTPGHIQHWSTQKFCRLLSKQFNIVEIRRPVPWSMLMLSLK